jgi:hypothetical protein
VQYIAPLVAPCPVITTVHDVHWRRFPETFPTKDRWLMELFLPLTFRRVAMVITDSQASQDDLVQFFRLPPDKVRVIYLAAEERFFEPLDRQRAAKSFAALRFAGRLCALRRRLATPQKFGAIAQCLRHANGTGGRGQGTGRK